jgi:transcription elongation factor Elf1
MSPAKPVARRKRAVKPIRKSLRKKKTPTCPECSSNQVVPVVHNPITPSLQHSIDLGRAVLADREEWEGMTEWHCKSCGCEWSRHSRRFKKPGGVNATRSN